ncbi:GxxExxY protein [Candidatus Wolfebacteria bacterium]|nr:GxxExxY protein [Candidatus Wolfebacteria bacterium]
MTANKPDLLHPELSYTVVGHCFNTHNELGRYAREKQYADHIESQLIHDGILYEREQAIGDSGNIADFVIADTIVLELKAVRALTKEHYRQLQNYLQQSGLALGLLVNFREQYLKPRRILRANHL